MKKLVLAALVTLLVACTDAGTDAGAPPPSTVSATQPEPDSPAGPSADRPYLPVLAGTADRRVGGRP